MNGSNPPGYTWPRTFARHWWCPRCEPLTVSRLVRPSTEPTAPPSWPMLEWAGPWTRPSVDSWSTYSSKARMSTSCAYMVRSSCGSADNLGSKINASLWLFSGYTLASRLDWITFEVTIMALPGLSGLDHIGFTVPDLEQARIFLVEVLGCEYMYSLGPFVHDDDWMREHLNVHPRAVMRQLHFFRCGGQAIFEVFHYEAPERATEQ